MNGPVSNDAHPLLRRLRKWKRARSVAMYQLTKADCHRRGNARYLKVPTSRLRGSRTSVRAARRSWAAPVK